MHTFFSQDSSRRMLTSDAGSSFATLVLISAAPSITPILPMWSLTQTPPPSLKSTQPASQSFRSMHLRHNRCSQIQCEPTVQLKASPCHSLTRSFFHSMCHVAETTQSRYSNQERVSKTKISVHGGTENISCNATSQIDGTARDSKPQHTFNNAETPNLFDCSGCKTVVTNQKRSDVNSCNQREKGKRCQQL